MTFTEAALEVLRSVGKPLHYKKITELAIERNLLSHVGKTPEVTMSSRLATMVKKDRGEAPIVKLRPGVFGLRKETKTTNGKEGAEHVPSVPPEQAEAQVETSTVPPKLPGADVFPEEEDDDELILAGLEEEERSEREGKRRRKRRRRRPNKGGDDGASNAAGPSQPPPKPSANKPSPKAAKLRAPAPVDMSREPAEGELLGKDLAEAVYAVLHKGGQKPQAFADVAERLVQRGRLSGDASTLAPTIAAAVRADIATRERISARPRFRVRDGLVGLIDWYLPKEMVWAEDAAMDAVERQRDQARREVLRRLRDLPPAGFAELMATWLNAEGVVALRAVRRPTSSPTEMHFAGMLKRGSEETRLAIMIRRDGKNLDRERVVEMRGSMHHYGQATACWLISTGSLLSGARDEVEAVGAAPCALFDGNALVEAMEGRGIGIRRQLVPLIGLDLELFEALGGTSPVIGTAAAPAAEADASGSARDKGKKRRSTRGDRARASGEERPKRKREPSDKRDEGDEASTDAAAEEVRRAEGVEPAADASDSADAEQPPDTQAAGESEAIEPPAPKRPARRRSRRREPRPTAAETNELEPSTSVEEAPAPTQASAEATEASTEAGAASTEDASAASATEGSDEDEPAVRPIPTVTLENPPSQASHEEPEAFEHSRQAAPESATEQPEASAPEAGAPEEGATENAEKPSNDRESDEEN